MFIKRGDNEKILSIIEDGDMTEEQKLAAKKLSKDIKKSNNSIDIPDSKKTGN